MGMFGQTLKSVVAPTGEAAAGATTPQAQEPQVNVKGMFSGIETAKPSEGGNYERGGHYIERIDRLKVGRSRKEKEFIVFEKTILHVYDDLAGTGHKVGESVAHMLTKTGNDMFLPNMKSIFAALAQCNPNDITGEICEKIITDKLLDGMVVECFNRVITTKKNTLFTDIKYKRELTPAEVDKLLPEEAKTHFWPNGELATAVAEGRARI